jgi:hypothetical protein
VSDGGSAITAVPPLAGALDAAPLPVLPQAPASRASSTVATANIQPPRPDLDPSGRRDHDPIAVPP